MKHQLIGEDESSYHVHDGEKNFLVAKTGLKEDLHAKIKGLPKYAAGGIVEGGDEEKDWSDYKPKYSKEQLENIGSKKLWEANTDTFKKDSEFFAANPDYDPNAYRPVTSKEETEKLLKGNRMLPEHKKAAEYYGLIPKVEAPAPVAIEEPAVADPAAPAVAPQVAPAQAPAGPNFYGQLQANTKKQADAIMGMADIQSKQALQQAEILEQSAMPEMQKQLQDRLQELETERVEVKKEIDAFRNAGAQEKIDPNRVWNNMSTGNKILATIGIILGGAGGGASGRNMALDVLDGAIDRDIKAQQANIDKKNSLYQINLARYKDATSAQQATYLQLNALTQGKIAALAARSQSELAKVNAQQMIAELENRNLAVGQQLYNAQAARAAGSVHPLANKIQALPENVRAQAWKELGVLRGLENAEKNIPQIMADSFKNSRVGEKAMSPFQSAELQKSTGVKLFTIVKSIVGEKMTDADVHNMVDPFVSGWTRNEKTNTKMTKDLMHLVRGKVSENTPVLTEFGLIPRQVNPAELGMVKRGK